jgi:hypothetical protein
MARVDKIMRASGAPAAELGLVKDNLGILWDPNILKMIMLPTIASMED